MLLGKLFGMGIGEAVQGIGNVIDQFVETDDEKRVAKQIHDKMMMQPNLAQIEINKIEAAHRSIFVAGWRPFVGWVCGFSLVWHFILFDMMSWISLILFPDVPLPKLAGTETLVTVLVAMLGLGGLRTFEKVKDKSK